MDASGSSWKSFQAMIAPVVPELTMSNLAEGGSIGVVRWLAMGRGASASRI